MIIFFIFLFGLIIGSFLNCLLWRLHTGESVNGRSYCPHCRHKIVWYDNIPLLSYLVLRGRCRHCHQKISPQYPIVELITAILFVYAYQHIFGTGLNYNLVFFDFLPNKAGWVKLAVFKYLLLLRDFFVIAVMIVIFIFDLRWYLILDKVSLPAIGIVFVINAILGFMGQNGWHNLFILLISGIIGSSIFLIQFLVSNGKWVGGGDIRLGFLMGVILGWPYILLGLFLAYFIGTFVSLLLIIFSRKKLSSRVPFGVFLSTATIISLFWGDILVNYYLNLFFLF